jgi:PAS domain S-box-containing protein
MPDPTDPEPPLVEPPPGRRVLWWLLLADAAVLGLIAVLLAVTLNASRAAHRQRASDAVESLARSLELIVAAELARVDFALQSAARGLHAGGAGALAQARADIAAIVPEAERLRVLDPPSGPPAATAAAGGTPSGPLSVTGPHPGDGRWVLELARRVSVGDRPRWVVAELDVTTFERMFAGLEIGGGGEIALRMEDFALVALHADPVAARDAVGSRAVVPQLRAAVAAQPRRGSFVAVTPRDGIERTVAYRRVGAQPLYVIVDQPTIDGLQTWLQEARLAAGLALLTAAMLAGASVLAYRAWRRTEASRRERDRERERLRALLMTASDALLVLDRSGTLVEFSDSFAALLGYPREALQGAHVTHWEARFSREQVDRVLRGFRVGERLDYRSVYRRRDGSTVDVDVAAVGLRLDGRDLFHLAARDVTERRRAMAAMQASEAFLDRTGRIAGVGGWELDLVRARLRLTAQARRLLDIPPYPPLALRRALRLFAPGGRRRLADAVARSRLDGLAWDLEVPAMTFQGRGLWLRCFGEPVLEKGQVVGMIGAVQDVTERRARNAELQREQQLRLELERQGREQERMLRERGEMLDVLAHEVRQPLNNASAALQGAAAALRELGGDEARQRLDRAQNVVGQVLARIDNTLAVAALLARPGPVEREETDIDTLVAVAVADMPAGERPRVRMQRDTAARSAPMDMSLMRLALRNLLSNALKYSPAGAPVIVRLADSEAPLGLLIDVIDRGPGVEPALQERLFERGARGHTPGSSHGLGLYIVRRVMELHGGQAQLLATGAQGTTMRLVVADAPDD